jgi:hypothetical protein
VQQSGIAVKPLPSQVRSLMKPVESRHKEPAASQGNSLTLLGREVYPKATLQLGALKGVPGIRDGLRMVHVTAVPC